MPPRQLLAGAQRVKLRIVPRSPLLIARATAPALIRPTPVRTFTSTRRVLEPGQREDLEHRIHDAQAAASFQGMP